MFRELLGNDMLCRFFNPSVSYQETSSGTIRILTLIYNLLLKNPNDIMAQAMIALGIVEYTSMSRGWENHGHIHDMVVRIMIAYTSKLMYVGSRFNLNCYMTLLSLNDLRLADLESFPKKYRHVVSKCESLIHIIGSLPVIVGCKSLIV